MRMFLTALFIFMSMATASLNAETILFQDPKTLQAASVGDYDTIKSELVKGDNPDTVNSTRETPLIVAAKGEYIDIIELLLEYNASINWRDMFGNTALFYAVDKTSYEVIEFLLDNGANPDITNESGVNAVMNAAIIGDRSVLQMLLNKNPDLTIRDYTGSTILDYARNSRNRGAENMLIDAGAVD